MSAVTFVAAIITGVVQGSVVKPGISRSGSMISALLGIDEVRGADIDLAPLLAVAAASFAVGYLALRWFFAVLRRGQFRIFAPYL